MALTYVKYTGDGVTKQYTFSFPYLSKDHVYVRVNSENKTFTWLNDSTVVLDDVPARGTSIIIYRNTPKNDYLVKFKAGTGFREQDLNMMTAQVFYVVQETMENIDVEELYMWRTEALAAKNTAVSAAGTASKKAQEASASALRAEASAQVAFGAEAEAWNPDKVYNYPDVVAFTDGHTYRCTGSNVQGASRSPKTSKQDWQRISVEQGRQFFEHDENGDYTPTLDPYAHDGIDGNSVLIGDGDPPSGLGKVGDSYIDRVSWGFWEKWSVIGWVNTGNVGSNFASKTFVHQQTTASAEWVIEHNLGKRPSVTIVSSSGEVVLGKVVYMSDNALTVYFRAPFSGEAYLN
jgi:hypothetical protein